MNSNDGNFCLVVTSCSLMLGSLLLHQNVCCSFNFCIVYLNCNKVSYPSTSQPEKTAIVNNTNRTFDIEGNYKSYSLLTRNISRLCKSSNYSEHFSVTKGCLTLSLMKFQPDKNSYHYCSPASSTKTIFALHFALRDKKDRPL